MDHTISVSALIALLSQLKPDLLLRTNAVDNLAVLSKDGDYLGYVEMRPQNAVVDVESEALAERAK